MNFKNLSFILFITIISVLVALPKNFNIYGHDFNRNNINFSLGNISFKRDLELKLGLDLVGGTHLTFDVDTTNITESEKEEAIKSLVEVVSRRVNLFGVSEPTIRSASFEGKDRIIVELPGIENTQEAIDLIGQTASLNFVEIGDNQQPILTDLSGADIKKAQVVFDRVNAHPVVNLEFTEDGARKFEEITGRNIDKPLPIILDNQVLSAPVVQDKIVGGSAQISGNFSIDEANNLAIQINGGALPAPMKLIEENTVEPSLGQESINKSVKAGLIGLGIVMVFMAIMYGLLGLVADFGLVLFGVYTLALYKLIPVVLTLPGIAGFILSVGMAVDANILTFERYREERNKGASKEYSISRGFGRAWDSIRDANIATLTTAFILANPFNWSFLHTSGPVRGFAVTLALGIFVSLFTGVYISKIILTNIIKDKHGKK